MSSTRIYRSVADGFPSCEWLYVSGGIVGPGLAAALDAYLQPWGTASQGDLVFDGVSTVLGVVPVGNVYTFPNSGAGAYFIQANNVTLGANVTVDMPGTGLVQATGYVEGPPSSAFRRRANPGGNGTGAAAGAAATVGPFGSPANTLCWPSNTSGAGAIGGSTVPGAGQNVGVSSTISDFAFPPATGGNGGAGFSAGGTGGTLAGSILYDGWYETMGAIGLINVIKGKVNTTTMGFVAFGGGGGGGAAGAGGGGGGAGGFPMYVSARLGIRGGVQFQLRGGAGGDGFTSGPNGGGGGGGGGGGRLFTLRQSGNPSEYSPVVTGGNGGIPGAGGVAGTQGAAGTWLDYVLPA